jgi:tetratricopeptide (TPR) repeat protein
VDAVYGANELYDVCRFRVKGTTTAAPLCKQNATQGQKAWLVGYALKKAPCKQYAIKSVETFMEKYSYYILDGKAAENSADCPVVNQNGEILGLCQLSKDGEEVHATDVRFINTFTTRGLSINDPLLRQTGIRVALPTDVNDARLMLMMAGEKNDTAAYVGYVEDFIRQFPTEVDGYSAKGQRQLANGNFAGVDATMTEAIAKCTNKDEAHSSYASLIYQKEVYLADTTYTAWNLQKALDEAVAASTVRKLPIYEHQQAQIVFAMGEYQDAYDRFIALTKSDIRNGELFYEAAQCRTHLGATNDEILTLLDSAVNVNPDQSISAPYYLARGRMLDQAGEYRKAILDYNKYDTLMFNRGSHEFYYIKFKCEMRIRQYQQALNDITRAIVMNPKETYYYAEKASLEIRVGMYDDAIATAKESLSVDPNDSDGYMFLGVAQCLKGNKKEGIPNLQKAKDMGNVQAEQLIQKYK